MSTDVSFDEIPQDVLEDVRLGIQHYLAPLLKISPDDPLHPVDLAGSGTFVQHGGRHYILTADHVWSKTENWAQIAVALAAEGTPLAIPRDNIVGKGLGGPPYSEWGPDLALLEIPTHLVPTIQARKSFLSLTRRRAMLSSHPPEMEKALWVVMGVVGQFSEVRPRDETGRVVVNIRGEAFFGVKCTPDDRGGYDYLTTYAKTTLSGVPSSFSGVSGGGLWQMGLIMNPTTGVISWPGGLHFRGVAFWEERRAPDLLAIRCHGPRSVFEKAWAEWELGSDRE